MTTLTAPPVRAAARSPLTITLILVAGSVMTAMDQTIVNVALNRLSVAFDAPLATLQWVATGYSLALAAIIPASAWAVGRVGAQRLYLTAAAVFAAGSLLAGTAWNIESLIAFRVLQGFGGGMLMPVGMTILIRAVEPERRGRMMSLLGLAVLVGPLAGPTLGGYLIDAVSWRWMFLINVPIGAAVITLAGRCFPADVRGEARPLDVPGLLALSPGLALLVYGVTAAGDAGGFASARVLPPLLAGAALIGLFVRRGLTAQHPLLDLRLLRDRSFALATATLALFALGYFGTMLLSPLYFQVVRGESALAAGALGIPFALASGLTMQVAGRLIERVPPGRYLPCSILVALTGFTLFMLQVDAHAPYWRLCATMLLMGAGGGGTMMPAITVATRKLSREDAPGGSTLVNLTTTTVSAIGTAVAAVLLAALLPVGGGLQALHRLGPDAHAALAPRLADAFQHTYLLAVVLMALAVIPAALLSRKE
ncbi:DHA2 family efflux MFS transporter permease subunit [Actinomadura atramentaria]|uniref:DHA2 family efflux MFS transporter permease subunit n=1 Tax=Actinomadura atramentaria TaxID=1990 RepID=UPI0003602D18|nr:DHA2 family efflux MFS transporter permease subunit [Actinomadura atramentaria]